MERIPLINYSADPNYGERLLNDGTYVAVAKRLIVGIRKASFEYLKAYILFPIIYRKKFHWSRNLTGEQKKYLTDGIIKLSYQDDIRALKSMIERELSLSLSNISTNGDPRFKIKLTKTETPDVFAAVKKILECTNAIDMARAQLKREHIRLEEFYLFIQDTAEGWRDELPELKDGLRTKTRYMHVDSSPPNSISKFIIYLNDVNFDNGPFEYIPRTHKLDGRLDSLIRRIMHHSRLQLLDDESRSLFSKLPKFLQKKAEFGNDINDKDWVHTSELCTGREGTVVVFDNSGVHRGALINSGRRLTIHGGFR